MRERERERERERRESLEERDRKEYLHNSKFQVDPPRMNASEQHQAKEGPDERDNLKAQFGQ